MDGGAGRKHGSSKPDSVSCFRYCMHAHLSSNLDHATLESRYGN
jgi:hypothetical protein